MLARNDEDMRRRLRVDVAKRHDVRRFMHELHGDFLLGDFAEQTLVGHGSNLRDHLSISTHRDRREARSLEPQGRCSQSRSVPTRRRERANFIRLETSLRTEYDDGTLSACTSQNRRQWLPAGVEQNRKLFRFDGQPVERNVWKNSWQPSPS